MVSVDFAFLGAALIILVGYIGFAFFSRTKVSEILILIFIGLLLGPVFNLFGSTAIDIFQKLLPFFASFALVVILFEGGLRLNFFKTLKSIPEAVFFTAIVFTLSLIFTAVLLFFFKMDLLVSLLIGAIVGGTSSAIVMPLVINTSAKEETKNLLSIESALTDVLCVVVAVAIVDIILLRSFSPIDVASSILSAFTIAAFLGFVFGLGWLRVLTSSLKGKPYEYLLTLAMLLLLFGVTGAFGGNGAVAALVFGLVLGNGEDITRMLRLTPRQINPSLKSFQMEVSFLVRTFFFVYLGILFRPEFLGTAVVVASLALLLLFVLARYLGARILQKLKPVFVGEGRLITMMSARGLAAAVLISLPLSKGIDMGQTFTEQMTAIVFLIIFLSNILTTAGIIFYEYAQKKRGEAGSGQENTPAGAGTPCTGKTVQSKQKPGEERHAS